MAEFRGGNDTERLVEYSDANIAFHQAIIRMSGCTLLTEMTENLFIHMRAIRKITIHQDNRAARSIVDHMRIIEALERRDAKLAERLAREHTLGLAIACRAIRRFSRCEARGWLSFTQCRPGESRDPFSGARAG